MNIICIICQAVFLGRIIKYDLSYDRSDEKTNEVLRLENLNIKNSIKYTAVNLGLDIFYILFNVFGHLIIFMSTKCHSIDFNIYSKNSEKKTNYKNDNDHINDFRGNNNNNKQPIKEVIVNNENLRENEKPVDNDTLNINLNIKKVKLNLENTLLFLIILYI